jgi:hypothetical protein
MITRNLLRLRLPISILFFTLAAGCGGDHANLPAPPETAEPAPPPTVTPTEDRGQPKAADSDTPASDEHAFSNVEGGEAERAASKRGHDSAGETAPAPAPGSGG